jgi:lipooligosaccharide transport system ATP-binding protein
MTLEARSDDDVRELSGGMKRRLVIARSLLNDPDLLILDEPTTGLDPQVRHLIWAKLRELKAQGVTLLLTTHYMEEAQQLCDRRGIRVEKHGDRVFLYAKTPSSLEKIAMASKADFQIRPTGLEDLFLKLTGRDLRESD